MTTTYRLDIYDTAGALQYVLDFKSQPTSLQYIRRLNAPGMVVFSVAGDHPILSDMKDKWQVEVWRKPDGGTQMATSGTGRIDASPSHTHSAAVYINPGGSHAHSIGNTGSVGSLPPHILRIYIKRIS